MADRGDTSVQAGRDGFPEDQLARDGTAATPLQDLIGGCTLAAVATAAMLMSLDFDVPNRVSTAPGLLPFITSATLLAMSLVLCWRAWHAGATQNFGACVHAAGRSLVGDIEERRGLLLLALVTAYVLLVAFLPLDLSVPLAGLVLEISTYEIVSVVMVAVILRVYWRAASWRCLLVALVSVEALALAFRFGFHLIMPETY
jgi:hypothetical protein